jgi:DNA-binding transcriptional MerR regulator
MANGHLAIGELGRLTDTKVETIRYYERIGLLAAPVRTSGNYRAYGPEHLNRLSFIRRSRDLGFPLDQIRALVTCPMIGVALARPSTRSPKSTLPRWIARSPICGRCVENRPGAAAARSRNGRSSKRCRPDSSFTSDCNHMMESMNPNRTGRPSRRTRADGAATGGRKIAPRYAARCYAATIGCADRRCRH